ncbi:hypothetical protein M8J75_009060 [Diaphorina citri]|nr:hypothetical protein M8J75_009060 [Diaphorina citri]
MTSRPNIQTFLNHTIQIRHEIMRFQSVHPNIYAIYELLDELPESVAQKIRDHVVCIEAELRQQSCQTGLDCTSHQACPVACVTVCAGPFSHITLYIMSVLYRMNADIAIKILE